MIKLNVSRATGHTAWTPATKNTFQHRVKAKIGRAIAEDYNGISHQKADIKIKDKPITRFLLKMFGQSTDNVKVDVKGKLSAKIGSLHKQKDFCATTKYKELKDIEAGKFDIKNRNSMLGKLSLAMDKVSTDPYSKNI